MLVEHWVALDRRFASLTNCSLSHVREGVPIAAIVLQDTLYDALQRQEDVVECDDVSIVEGLPHCADQVLDVGLLISVLNVLDLDRGEKTKIQTLKSGEFRG